ncbi:uncharacterized protein LOC111889798 [Lactuca sativa]|uniref:Myb-like domain-containing protein n=1 Tax=Lactuca sativa TaxID=4236 RepID=A0A9R1UI58_LACSA|nr:uncharacterized protein LOC111889798 [Lactuca sativa]KAJ0187589.1 hypothetical protein LSAT_V11C900497370 [Lactuca sativa]
MMDFTEKELCVLCERGGKLLVCNDNGCPISVHEDCMGCSPRFNETGNFCCPYCVYRRLTTETCQLRDKAMLAKKALSSFLGENVAQNQSKSFSSPCESKHETSVSEETDRIPNRNGEFSGVCDGSTCRIMVVYDGDACKEQGMNAKRVPVEDEAGSSEKKTTAFNGKPPLLKGKRKRWSEEEEDMLKEGVQKFSATANKNFPWKKVLEFGRHVFHTSRTPSDLKDKWRNISK